MVIQVKTTSKQAETTARKKKMEKYQGYKLFGNFDIVDKQFDHNRSKNFDSARIFHDFLMEIVEKQ